jgi:hypothetical protein
LIALLLSCRRRKPSYWMRSADVSKAVSMTAERSAWLGYDRLNEKPSRRYRLE